MLSLLQMARATIHLSMGQTETELETGNGRQNVSSTASKALVAT